jgi:hypothetical protein
LLTKHLLFVYLKVKYDLIHTIKSELLTLAHCQFEIIIRKFEIIDLIDDKMRELLVKNWLKDI